MSVVLKDIDVKKRSANDYGTNKIKMYDLKEYRDISKKCIVLFSGSHLTSKMINDEDAISHVSEHVMWGHIRWKDGGGKTLRSYLNQCAIWAIKSWKTKMYKQDTKKIQSLDCCLDNPNDAKMSRYDLISDKKSKEPFDIIFNSPQKDVEEIISKGCLTKLQTRCVRERYIEGKKLREIAEAMSVSRQAVNQHIKKAIKKLRKMHVVCE